MQNNENNTPDLPQINKNQIDILKECFNEIPKSDKRTNVAPEQFIIILIFAFFRDTGKRTISSLRRNMIEETKTKIARSTFWERLATKRLLNLLTTLTNLLMKKMTTNLSRTSKELIKILDISGILILDSSSTTLPDNAQTDFPAPRHNVAPASIKWHLCVDVLTGMMQWFTFSPATTHDSNCFPLLDKIKGKLIIFDLGYYDYHLMATIGKVAYFLSRVKTNAIINIVKVSSGIHKQCKGQVLSLNLPRTENIIEILGEVKYKSGMKFKTRVIGFWNPLESKYHWYFTNLTIAASLIYTLYRLRWQIELIFKSCKSSLALKDITSSNTNIIKSMHLLTLIAILISYPFAKNASLELEDDKQAAFSFQRASMFLTHTSRYFIQFLLLPLKKNRDTLIEYITLFISELFDPNYKNRNSSLKNLMVIAGVNF